MHSLADIRFRSNPLIELRPFAGLGAGQRERFRDLESDPDAYGLFIPRPPLTTTLKTAAAQTAELFQSLMTPARIDRSVLDDGESAADLVDLVLDGILEVEHGDGFVCGADALSILAEPVREAGGRLEHDALLHAQELETNDPQTLAMALYHYHQIPLSPFWKTRFAGPHAILAHVGADRGTLRALLERNWTLSGDTSAWLSWTSLVAPVEHDHERATYKLYVSPRPECIRGALEVLVRVLTETPASFKMGSSAAGLLRPDKLVAYFATREQLDEAASMMRRELAGCEAHGVPFTAPLDESGLLSWGVDPPETERVLRWLERSSWRLWIVRRLGGAMAVAKFARTATAAEPRRFAVARVQRLGVNTDTWTPSSSLWERP